ncbi:polyketide cyclase [Asticcacaulis sp. AC460]|uniref:SRPBCC family protein n=1 Tax=Asticcacaulis sp. AC460 TaxID=1282360 RepID=UPI0003C3E913|nr:SRPBCC family protein [Asticcacaulis sp. AC460]ESQ88008.1 polyketide cyclase [Asticcacaulis sp. AC460]
MAGVETTKGSYGHSREASVDVAATPDLVFAHMDDQSKLGSHMEKPSMMMMGGRMTYEFDAAKGQAVGSVIKMGGGFLGVKLSVEEVITVHDPPRRKVWETCGQSQILIIGAYRMGFEITPAKGGSHLRVFIDYNHLTTFFGGILSLCFASIYARWCVSQMASDARRAFLPRLKPVAD